MTEQHPITPPTKLVYEWVTDNPHQIDDETYGYEIFIATRAAQWGADQELKACCEWLRSQHHSDTWPSRLYTARRPKPPSLKEQALAELAEWENNMNIAPDSPIRRAIEQLPDS
jgi:hypothetical protein